MIKIGMLLLVNLLQLKTKRRGRLKEGQQLSWVHLEWMETERGALMEVLVEALVGVTVQEQTDRLEEQVALTELEERAEREEGAVPPGTTGILPIGHESVVRHLGVHLIV